MPEPDQSSPAAPTGERSSDATTESSPVTAVEPQPSAAATPPPVGTAPPAPGRSGLATAAMAGTVLLWASAFVVIRHVGADVSPGALTLGRLAVGSLVLGAFVLSRRPTWPTRSDWPRLLTVGLLWFAVYNIALNAAEQRLDAGTAAMLVNVAPVLLAVLAGWWLGEGFPRPLIVGSVVGFGGVVLIGLATSTGDGADLLGVLLCLLAALGYAVAVIAQKPLLVRLSALQVTWIACTVGMVACLPFAPDLVGDLRRSGTDATLGVVYLGLGPTAIAFTTWAYALARTSAGRLGATTYLVPPIAIGLGWLLLEEVPPALALVGGAVCLLGVGLTRRSTRAGRPARRGAAQH